jgi:hypothetical protein
MQSHQTGSGVTDIIIDTPMVSNQTVLPEHMDICKSPVSFTAKKRKMLSFETDENQDRFMRVKPNLSLLLDAKESTKGTESVRKGYNLFATKLRIQSKPLSTVLPTAQKAVLSKDWQV